MTLIKWRPATDLARWTEDFDRIFDRFFSRWPLPTHWVEGLEPDVDLYETDQEVVLKAHLPGVKKEDLDLTISEDHLTLRGEVREEEKVERDQFYRRELRYGSFCREIPLPRTVKSEEAKASYRDGVLEVRLPKAEAPVKGIKVQIE